MLEAKKAAFGFESFKVPNFMYNEGKQQGAELKLGFLPSGRYDSKTGTYELSLKFIAHDTENNNQIIFELTGLAIFKFNTAIALSEIPNYFYMNAIAIMFPYVRAFISTMTLQANTKLLKLGLMNLSDLEQPLIDNTIEI